MLFVALQAAYDTMPFLSLLTLYPPFLSDKVRENIFRKERF